MGHFLTTMNCFDENHPTQEITFMCSDSVAMSSIATAASHALTTCMTSENIATVNNAQPRTVLRDASVQQVLNISVFRVESARWPDGPLSRRCWRSQDRRESKELKNTQE